MFSPLSAYPIGSTDSAPNAQDVIAAGTLGITGASAATVLVQGAGAGTLSITGSGTVGEGAIPLGSLLAWGPIGAGAIAEIPSLTGGSTAIAGAGAGTFGITGAASILNIIYGRAPDISETPWIIVQGDASATVQTYPAPAVMPDWLVSVQSPGFVINQYPNISASIPAVPFLALTGSATGSFGNTVIGAGNFNITGAAAAGVQVAAIGAGTLGLTGQAGGGPIIGGVGAGALDITGSARGGIGLIEINGIAAGDFEITGAGVIEPLAGGRGAGLLDFTGAGVATVSISGAFAGIFDLTGTGKTGLLSGKRRAAPEESANGGRVLSNQEYNRLVGNGRNG